MGRGGPPGGRPRAGRRRAGRPRGGPRRAGAGGGAAEGAGGRPLWLSPWRLAGRAADAWVKMRGPPDVNPAPNEAPDGGCRAPAAFHLGGSGMTLAGGCFWCLEAALSGAAGVEATRVGYTGGLAEDPSYIQVASRRSGHVEAVAVKLREEDGTGGALEAVLGAYLDAIDPLDDSGQGSNRGPQYRPCVFFHTAQDGERVRQVLAAESERRGGRELAVRVRLALPFHEAEEAHQKYYEKNGFDPEPDMPYWMGAFLE